MVGGCFGGSRFERFVFAVIGCQVSLCGLLVSSVIELVDGREFVLCWMMRYDTALGKAFTSRQLWMTPVFGTPVAGANLTSLHSRAIHQLTLQLARHITLRCFIDLERS